MTEEMRKIYIEAIQDFCLMDDVFFSKYFDGETACTQYVLRIILDKSDLIVKSATSQYGMENFFGRGVRLDVFAEDSAGKLYNIEVQRNDEGAIPQRARYNSSMLDTENLEKGAKFKALPEAFVIFITEHDVLKGGEQIYHIERVIKETGKNFGDGSHIIYVNGSIRSGSRLGDLMHDFFCKESSQMKSNQLMTRADFVKHSRKAVYEMSEVMERIAERISAEREAKARAEGKAEGLLESIRALMERLHWTAEVAMDNLGISPEKQKELAPLI
ncbi:MAG: PD-(D/E)XK nuclease family transposase [Selenomonadaceae bacterium]|nr:PD-(D/E)XK nuclease family transposase [Selenomonadaceae bacterium]